MKMLATSQETLCIITTVAVTLYRWIIGSQNQILRWTLDMSIKNGQTMQYFRNILLSHWNNAYHSLS